VTDAGWADVRAAVGAAWEALESSPAEIAIVVGPEQVLVFQNAASRKLFGPFELGKPLAVSVPGAGQWQIYDEVMREGRVVTAEPRAVGPHDATGNELVMRYVVAPFGEGPPHPAAVITAINVTYEVMAAESLARAQMLATVSARMSTAADPDQALKELTEALVPDICDVAAVFVTHADPADQGPPVVMSVTPDLLERLGPPPTGGTAGSSPWDEAVAAGRTVLIDLADPATRPLIDPASLAWLDAAECSTLVVLPLSAAGSLTGAVVLAGAHHRHPFRAADLPFLEDTAARAGVAVAALRDLRRQRQIAVDLQRALLPDAPPALPGLEIAARYVAGATDVDVGGDWWDVTHLGAGRVGIGVGDVSGRGVPAAVIMGQLRSAMRAAARAALSPGDLLGLLDTHALEVLPEPGPNDMGTPPRFATCLYAVLEPYDGVLRVASAGHLPLLVRTPRGPVVWVAPPPGPPLGLGLGPFDEVEMPFPAGSVLVACTDGLVEGRGHDFDEGMARVAALLSEAEVDGKLDELADTLLREVAPSTGEDDIALVLVRLTAAGAPVARVEQTLHTAADVPGARRAAAALAHEHLPAVSDATASVADELLTNALQHAGAPVTMRAHVTSERLVVEVEDTSALVPRPTAAADDQDGGRGLTLVAALADAWGVRLSRTGKTTWAELRRAPLT
jgi:serine phosphatase RsbU (regulator of sigma subunit)/anti-sigma regulatory factor (Ser/Thr protein kinase)